MSTVKLLAVAGLCLVSLSLLAQPLTPRLGKKPSKAMLRNWNQDVYPDGWGLPKGQGTAVEGEKVYKKYCLSCHGVNGTGSSADELAGAQHGLTDNPPDKTIGTYWPYATTIFDFTRRSMPLNAPGSLSDDQVYAVTAYLLYLNEVIGKKDVINRISLPMVNMPNRRGFVSDWHFR